MVFIQLTRFQHLFRSFHGIPFFVSKQLFIFLFWSLSDKFSSSTNKRQKTAQDFLISIDQTGELLALFEDDEIDDVKQERMEVNSTLFSKQSTKTIYFTKLDYIKIN